MLRKTYTFSFLVMAGVLLAFSSAFAQMMGGSFSLEASFDEGKVSLSWEKPESFNVSYYLVYRGQLSMTDTSANITYNKIDSTTGTEYRDTTVVSGATVLAYQVRAFNDSGRVEVSNFAKVFINSDGYSRDHVTITSTPVLNGTVDSLYNYHVTAVSSDSTSVFTYRLGEDHPPLMTINDSTGLISWTPQVRGWYDVDVYVISSNGGHANQEFAIRVSAINGTIAGVVKDTLGNPIRNVLVKLYQRDMEWHFDYHAVTDSTGHYAIHHVDAGKYFVRAIPMNPKYLPQWYNGVYTMALATPVVVSDTTPQAANFRLEDRFAALPKFTVGGTVTDTNGAAIKGALVVFARAGFVFNSAKESQNEWQEGDSYREVFQNMYTERYNVREFSLEGSSPYVYKTYTDSNGVYSDTLPQGFYIAFAKASGYQKIFYNNESNLLSADIIALNSDTSNISFALAPLPPVALGAISGSVLDSTNGTGVAARIIAFRDVWDYRDTLKMHVANAYFTDADSTGAYTLNDLPPGYYKILAVPLGSYMPSFYSMTGPTVKWKDASAVPVDGNSTSGINIYVMPMASGFSGYTSINGKVTSNSNSEGVSGALVYAFDQNGNLAGYGITDDNGSYTIPGLAPGTYTVSTDVVGFTSSGSQTSSPTYDASGNPVSSTSNLTVSPDNLATAVQQSIARPVNYTLDQNYPNPFNPTTQIAFSIPSPMHVNVTIFNILGQRIATIVDANMGAGSHVVMWNARNSNGVMMPSGVYFYRLSTPNFTAVKKMLLLK
ncbi:MAG: carboxypeptidase regulatory-like domain-containing protein [Bacteroidetes bacterium]|nr:carboxypeptidase regulatory-like domain-containing protein [Bacteroidota bacterium]